mmetsp:Transcript_34109/g.47497  ORF Transcript_34109/g.47497 Transcript_34109/m.47497 type:complete len:269 (+) Transcript_34109:73-879(+)
MGANPASKETQVLPGSTNSGFIPPDAFQIFPRLPDGELLRPQKNIPSKYKDKLEEKQQGNSSTRIKILSDHPNASSARDLNEEDYYFHVTDLTGRGYHYAKDEALIEYEKQLLNPPVPPNIPGYRKHPFTNIDAPSLNHTTFQAEEQESEKTRYFMKAEDNFKHFLLTCKSKAQRHPNCAGFVFYIPTNKGVLTYLNGLCFAIFKSKKRTANDNDAIIEENTLQQKKPTWIKIKTDPEWGQYLYMKENSEVDVKDCDCDEQTLPERGI